MPRPPKLRRVSERPVIEGFIPNRLPPWGRQEVVLPVEGFEALRLSDFEGLDQERAAGRMEVSRQTYGRILSAARHTVAEALIMGKFLRIEGGSFETPSTGVRGRHGRRWGKHFKI
ncbi:MAG: DUF134 domain-containing protein [Desulfatiglandaceae bacterium]